MRITIARSWQEVEVLKSAWESLQGAGDTLFQSFRWNLLAARIFAVRQPPLVVYAESAEGAAVIPACRAERGLRFLGEKLSDYRDVLAVGSGEALREAWQRLAQHGSSFRLTCLAGERARSRWSEMGFAPQFYTGAPRVRPAETTADAFGHQHSRLARQVRRLARAGAVLREHPGGESVLVRSIYELKAAQPQAADNLFGDRLRREFMVAAADDSGCEVFTLETAGTLVAALVTFRDQNVRRFYTTYYDHSWSAYSPGSALLFEVTRRSLAEGLDCDYMTGEQPHKMRFATSSVPLFRVRASAEDLGVAGSVRLQAA